MLISRGDIVRFLQDFDVVVLVNENLKMESLYLLKIRKVSGLFVYMLVFSSIFVRNQSQ